MWKLKRIPKIAHFYWGEEKLPYLRYLTIASFRQYNPDWKIRVYYPKYRQNKKTWTSTEHNYRVIIKKDYFEELKKLRITFVEIDFKSLDLSNDLTEVHKSDYLRWFLLANIGGLWSDMDIIYIDSMNNMNINTDNNEDVDTLICHHWFHWNSIGFLLSSKDNKYYQSLWKLARERKYDPTNYQAIGSVVMNIFPASPEQIQIKFPKLKIGNMSMDTVYPYSAPMIHILHADKLNLISKETIGLHWYAGHYHSGEFVNKITEENGNKINNAVAKIVDISLNNKKEKALKDVYLSNFNNPAKKRTLTVQSVVKNEAFIYYSIKSIYPYADKILLYDTGSNDKHTLEDIQKLLKEDTEHKIIFKQIPLDFDEEKWSLKNLKAFMKEHKGKMSVGKVRQIQIEDTDTEFFMLVDGDEVHYKSTMEKIVNEILPKLSDNIVGVNIPIIWYCDMQHVFAVNTTGRIWRTDKVAMNNESPNEAHCFKDTGIAIKATDKEYLIYKDIQPYAHFETFLKPWRRTPTRRMLFTGKLPEVMEENPYYIERYLNEKDTLKSVNTLSSLFPKASILIPSFKRAHLLKWGLESLVQQECPYSFEVIVLNDGVQDDTEALCKEYSDKLNIRYIFTGQRNKEKVVWRCPGFPLNIGIKQAKADYIIFTCPEIYHLDKFAVKKTIEALMKESKIMVRPTGKDDQKGEFLEYVKKTNGKIGNCPRFRHMRGLQTHLPFFLGIHKKDLIEIGGYNEDFIGWAYDDTDLVLRLQLNRCKYVYIDSMIVHLYHSRHRLGIEFTDKMYKHNRNLQESVEEIYKTNKNIIYSNVERKWGVLDKEKVEETKSDNTWKLKRIPKVVHFYWGNDKLPYLRYLTLLSFRRQNPDWKINLYIPPVKYKGILIDTKGAFEFKGIDYYERIKSLNIDIKTLDLKFIEEKCGELEAQHGSRQEVYKSDFLRWYLLSTEGGLWSDMDIMYFKPMSEIAINQEENNEIDTVISLHPKYKHSVGFMLSSPNNEYYNYMLEKAKQGFNPKDYQSIGVALINPEFPTIESIEKKFPNLKVKDIPITTVYAYDALTIVKIYNSNDMNRYNENSIGLHWYAGHCLAKEFISKVDHKNYGRFDNVLCKTIVKVYQ